MTNSFYKQAEVLIQRRTFRFIFRKRVSMITYTSMSRTLKFVLKPALLVSANSLRDVNVYEHLRMFKLKIIKSFSDNLIHAQAHKLEPTCGAIFVS